MSKGADVKRIALSLQGTVSANHFDRLAFKVARIFATLAAHELTANLKFLPDQQALKCATAPEAFAPVPGAFGSQGWTTVRLAAISADELRDALTLAWSNAQPRDTATAERRKTTGGRRRKI